VEAVILAGILILGIFAQWLAWRLRMPAIVPLLAFGFAVGNLAPYDRLEPVLEGELLFPFVSLAVAVILFEGGLSLHFREIRETRTAVIRLVSIGILVTWGLTALFAWLMLRALGVSPSVAPTLATLIGAILTVSGPTVIIPLLRHIRPTKRFGSLVKWEGIVNDPVGAVLAVLVFEAITIVGGPEEAVGDAAIGLLVTVVGGLVIGLATAYVIVELMRRFWIPDFLQNPAILAAVVGAFVASNAIQPESGLVTVTIFGIALANQKRVTLKHVLEFKESLSVVLLSILFIVLAARVKVEQLMPLLSWQGLGFLAALLLIVRPAAVAFSTIGSDLNWRERLGLSWLAPRGIVAAAVASLFSLEMAHKSNVSDELATAAADVLVPVVFLVIVGTVVVYGFSVPPLARWLKLSQPNPQGILFAGASGWVRAVATAVKEAGFQVMLVDTNYVNITSARMAGLPTCYASVISDYVTEDLELPDIGRLLAVTPNAEVNTLATQQMAERFGWAQVYQLPSSEAGSERRSASSRAQRARFLFNPEATYQRLSTRFAAGAQVKATQITEEFSYKDFRAMYGDSALVMFVVVDGEKLRPVTTEKPPEPEPDDVLIALVDPSDEEKKPEQKKEDKKKA